MVEDNSKFQKGKAAQPHQANSPPRQRIPINHLVGPIGSPPRLDSTLLCQNNDELDPRITDYIVGVQFRDAKEEWIRDDTFRYSARVITEALQFRVAVVMKLQMDSNDEEVKDIELDLTDVARNYQLEINWIDEFVSEPHFGYLISSFADYSRKSVIRAKILGSIKEKGYLTLEKCEEDEGGILIYVHRRGAVDDIYFKIQWSVRFVTKYWSALHFFSINPVQADEEFVRANKKLLRTFCKIGVDKDELEALWNKLCLNIERHKP